MVRIKRSLAVIGACAAFCVAAAAQAQESGGNVASNVIGPPQLRDFSLEPRNRIVAPPAPAPMITPLPEAQQPPVRVAPPPAAAAATTPSEVPSREAPPREAARSQPAPAPPTTAAPAPLSPAADIPAEAPVPSAPLTEPSVSVPENVEKAPATAESSTGFSWLYASLALALILIGAAMLRRRRHGGNEADAGTPRPVAAPVASVSVRPRPEPGMRPWLELELKTERAAFTDAEASVNFELEIRNSGKSPARNLRIDVKMFNGSEPQDREIGAFFRTAGRETTRLGLPEIAAGQSGVIRGEVGMPRDQMRALRLDDRMLFIPVIAVNALYDCQDGRTGQTSCSYIVGRELQAESERMGAFRVDQGPRIWRTVGQRPHKLARRV
jgi:hypothetical protein